MARGRHEVDVSLNVPTRVDCLTFLGRHTDIWEVDATSLPRNMTREALAEIKTCVRKANDTIQFQNKLLVDFVERRVSQRARVPTCAT